MKVQVLVRLKSGVLDVQGKAVEHSIADMGHQEISDIRIGKLIELNVKAANFEAAKRKVEELCQALLANPIIEQYEIRQG